MDWAPMCTHLRWGLRLVAYNFIYFQFEMQPASGLAIIYFS